MTAVKALFKFIAYAYLVILLMIMSAVVFVNFLFYVF